jgi:OmpA-OmpF porin, OOP family
MKTMIKLISLALMLGAISATGVFAATDDNDKPLFSVTPYLGHANWDTDLQVDDGVILGGRGAFHFLQWLSVEGTYGYNSSSQVADGSDVGMTHFGADLVAELLPSARINPYLTAGWAQINHDPDGGEKRYLNGWEAGVGAKIRLGGDNASYRALRIEVRDVMSDLSEAFPNYGDSKHSIMTTIGVQFAFGKSSKDTDNDGVLDKNDACPDTPAGVVIDESGCPVDSDGDGVFDGLDQCDATAAGVVVDASGCPIDSDGDGVFDGLDQCDGTPAGATVDANGCPTDSDGDGVFDGIDQCENTETNYQVDANGCPIAVTAIEEELLDTGSISTSNIVFESSSSDLDLSHNKTIDEVGAALANWPELRVEVGGFTDSSGSEAFNQQLSEKRAQSVLDYLAANFPDIDAAQYTAVGYGEASPVADNSTPEGRTANRRVEFKVLNTEELKREIEQRKMLER